MTYLVEKADKLAYIFYSPYLNQSEKEKNLPHVRVIDIQA
jgi:hypothetical protein